MNWMECIIHTTTEGADWVSQCLMDLGASGTMIEDKSDIPDPSKPHGYWEIIDPNMPDSMPEDVLVHAWFEAGASLSENLRTLSGILSGMREKQPLYGSLQMETNLVSEDSWNDEWNYKSSNPFMRPWHNYRNPFMVKQILTVFDSCSRDLDTFIWQSQFVQAEANRTFIENFRAGKFKTKGGIVWWNLRDGWPMISDAVVDWYGGRKMAYEAIKEVQRDVLVMVGDDFTRVKAVNDTRAGVKGRAKVTDAATGKVFLEKEFSVPANGVAEVGAVEMPGQGLALIEWTVGGCKAKSRCLYGKPPFKLADVRGWTSR